MSTHTKLSNDFRIEKGWFCMATTCDFPYP
jgi:hypothetical protein